MVGAASRMEIGRAKFSELRDAISLVENWQSERAQ
jgi:hypothetical protein